MNIQKNVHQDSKQDGKKIPKIFKLSRQRIIGIILLGLVIMFMPQRGTPKAVERGTRVTYSEITAAITNDNATKVWLDDGASVVIIETADSKHVYSDYPVGGSRLLMELLADKTIDNDIIARRNPSFLPSLLLTLLPVMLILGFFVFLAKRGSMGGLGALGLGRNKPTPVDIPTTRFSDVAGIDDALVDLREVVELLHNPDRYSRTGATRPRGFLLVGPPGTGKTLLARAVAGEAGVPFYAISGSAFVELFAGLGASRVRSLFAEARTQPKAIVFIDEIDAVGKIRGRGMMSGANDERENTLNALLVELDGFSRHSGIVILAATNRADVLDPALLRPGRFDRTITIPTPDRGGRRKILELYAVARPFAKDINWEAFARRIPGMTGAQIEQLLNESALEAARQDCDEISADHVETSLRTTVLGRARTGAIVTERDRNIIAWHESGHALMALLLEAADNPAHISITPRGGSGGATWMTGGEHDLLTVSQAKARLIVALGGRAAEEILLDGDFTQGAHNDLAVATALATEMVAHYGMGEKLISRQEEKLVFDGPVGQEIDREVNGLLTDALKTAKQTLLTNRALLKIVAEELIERENLTLADLQTLVTNYQGKQKELTA